MGPGATGHSGGPRRVPIAPLPTSSPTLPAAGPLLAVDVGEKRIGLALSDPTQVLAHPLDTITRRRGRRFPMLKLRHHLEAHGPVAVVVGLPLTPEGEEGHRCVEARAIGRLIEEKASLPVDYWDERMTTARALRAADEQRRSTMKRRELVDSIAATVLLQSYLDARRP
jgi:putative holliday junction resolvase